MDFYTWFESMVCKGELRREDQAVAELAWRTCLEQLKGLADEEDGQDEFCAGCYELVRDLIDTLE